MKEITARVIPLKGVGKNLQDHISAGVTYLSRIF
jgi:hypothetical protein